MNSPISRSLPLDPVAALLSHGSSAVNPVLVAQRIEKGQWHLDTTYTHEGLNLIELLAENADLTDQDTGAIELVCTLVKAGVYLPEDAWNRVNAFRHGNDGGKIFKLFLRGVGEGEKLAAMRDACITMSLFRPVDPVEEQANKVLNAVQAIGGWSRQIQGVSLALWIVCHDEIFSEGGYTQSNGTEYQRQAWRKLRKLVFGTALKADGVWNPSALELILLDWNANRKNEKEKNFKDCSVNAEKLLEEVSMGHPRVKALVAARLFSILAPSEIDQQSVCFEDADTVKEGMAALRNNALACLRLVLSGVDVNLAAEKPLRFLLASDLDVVSELPLNKKSVARVVNILANNIANGKMASGFELEKIFQQWTAGDLEMVEYARWCARQQISKWGVSNKEIHARLKNFWLSLNIEPILETKSNSPRF